MVDPRLPTLEVVRTTSSLNDSQTHVSVNSKKEFHPCRRGLQQLSGDKSVFPSAIKGSPVDLLQLDVHLDELKPL